MFSFGSNDGNNSTNAYMCFYERDHKTKINLVANTDQHKKDIIESLGFNPMDSDSEEDEEGETIENKETKDTGKEEE
jgi:hypothetical protein